LSDLVNSNKNTNINKDKILYILKLFINLDYYYYKYIDNSIYRILNNSSFKLNKNEKGIIEYREIKFDDYILKYDELSKKNIPVNNKLKESYEKFLQLLNDIKNELENKSKDLYKFNLELMFRMENENSKDSNLFNLTCNYKLDNETSEFKDKDILKLKKISDSKDGFLKLTTKISEDSNENNISELTDSSKEATKSNIDSNNNNSNTFNRNLSAGSPRETTNSSKTNISESSISFINLYKLFKDLDKIKEDEDNKKNIFNIISLKKIIQKSYLDQIKEDIYNIKDIIELKRIVEKSESEFESELIIDFQNELYIAGFLNGKLVLYKQNLNHMQSLELSYEIAKKNNNIKENDLSRTSISIHETKESNINEAILIRCLKFGLRKLVIKFKDQTFIQAMNNIEIIKEKDEEK
jgi:hypothetical protein